MGITREKAIILLSIAVAVSSVFVSLSLGIQLTSCQRQVESLQSNIASLEVSSELYRLRVAELEGEVAEYQSRVIELQNEVDRSNSWRTYRNQLEEAYLENARLKGLLLEREIDENFTAPTVSPRKLTFRIGDTITFMVESELPLYGSYFNVWDPEGNLIWEGDPIGNWVEIADRWVAPFYGQTAYLEPMVLEEDMPLGEWTWSYGFGDIINIQGTFTVLEKLEDILSDMG